MPPLPDQIQQRPGHPPGPPVSANAINKDVGVHTKVSLNVRHRVVSPARIAERTASPEIRLKL